MINTKTYNLFKAHLQTHNPAAIKKCIWFIGFGDSILAGVAAGPDDGASVGPDVAWSCYVRNNGFTFERLKKSTPGIGGYSSIVALAQRLYEQTGWHSVVTMIPKAATTGVYESQPAFHWDPGHADGNMFLITDQGLDRSTILPMSKAAIDMSPAMDVQKVYGLWAGGAIDAAGLVAGTVTKAEITDWMIRVKNWLKANYGANGLMFYEGSVMKRTSAESIVDQSMVRDMIGLREAHNAAVAADPEIWNVYPHSADTIDTGVNFNVLQVKADGTWLAGHELHDDAHWSEAMNTCVGKTAAQEYIAPIVGTP